MNKSEVIFKTKLDTLSCIGLFVIVNAFALFLLLFFKNYVATLIVFSLSIFITYYISLYSSQIIFYEDYLIIYTPTRIVNKNEKISYKSLISIKQKGFYQRGDISILFYKNKKRKSRYISSSIFAEKQYDVIEEILKEIIKKRRLTPVRLRL